MDGFVCACALEVLTGVLTGADAARIKAMNEPGGASTAIAALTAKAKLGGLWIERTEQTTKSDLSQYSDAELAAVIRGGLPKEEFQLQLN